VLDLWPRLGARTGQQFRLLIATILPANGQMTQEYKLQIHFTTFQSQWIKRMTNSGPEMVIWCVVVVECWICGQDLGQTQVKCSDI
jgi:hypothetical protein